MFKTRRKIKIILKDTGQWNCRCMGTRELLFPGQELLSPCISLKKLTKWKHSSNDQRTFPLVIILFIVVTYLLYNVLISLRENRRWSSLGLGFIIKACAFTGAAYLWLHKVLNTGIKIILYTIMVKNITMVILLQIIYTIFPSKRKKFCQSFFLEFSVLCLSSVLCNSFSQTEEVWINETCLKAKIKASAWKTIRKAQYDNYEDYFSVLCIGINLLTNKYNLEVWYYPCNTCSLKFW